MRNAGNNLGKIVPRETKEIVCTKGDSCPGLSLITFILLNIEEQIVGLLEVSGNFRPVVYV